MFSVLKLFYYLFKSGNKLLNPNLNPLRYAPPYVKYFATILLACFWCLAFGLYFKNFEGIGYNMFGHIAVISMVFVTWGVFQLSKKTYGKRNGTLAYLRMPDASSRCDELTDEERSARVSALDKKY
jgi:fatty acid desaturase